MMAIDTLEAIQAGGTTQWIRIRGADASSPVLLLIQQGPGLPMINEARRFGHLLGLEQAFTVVYWDQRGCGRSLRGRQDRAVSAWSGWQPTRCAYSAELNPAANPRASDPQAAGPQGYRSFGWARATGSDGATAQAWLQTGEAYAFTAAASIRAVEETLTRSLRGAFSPAAAFGADFALTVPDTTRVDTIPAEAAVGRR